MAPWHSLYWTLTTTPNPTTLAEALAAACERFGYAAYNPFGLMPAPLYDHTIKAFVAPAHGHWGRVLFATHPPGGFLNELASKQPALAMALLSLSDEGEVYSEIWADGTPANEVPDQYLPEGVSATDLETVRNEPTMTILDERGETVGAVPLDTLPEQYREMAAGLDDKAMAKMFDKMAGKMLGGADADAAANLLRKGTVPWDSAGGQRILRILSLLGVPDGWHMPTFTAVSDAYGLHARRKRKPDARLYPGDREAMDAVSDALDYIPVFFGKDN